jgi:hypothetical protein
MVRVDERPARRVRLGCEIEIGGLPLGLAAEGLVTLLAPGALVGPLPVLGADAPPV